MTLEVQIGRETVQELEAPETYTAEESFELQIINHGRPVHVYVHADEPLERATTVESGNHYLEPDDTLRMTVSAETDLEDPLSGVLRVVSGYGADESQIDVTLQPPGSSSVPVGESLAEPSANPDPGLLTRPAVPVLALGVVAALIALVAVVLVQTLAVLLGAVAVLVAVAAGVIALQHKNRD